MAVFTMPSLGADMEAGKLVEWRIRPGDRVARGDVVAVVETQKGAIEIEIFEAGEVEALEAELGQTVPVGAPLARIRPAAEAAPAGAAGVQAPMPAEKPPALAARPPPARPAPPSGPPPASSGGPALASPAARARAAEAGINLSLVAGSGPGGAILLADVERLIAAPAPAPAPAARPVPPARPGLDMTEMRKAIAAAMSRSKREIPHYYLSHLIDLQPATDWLAEANAARAPEDRLLMGALFLRATVRALGAVPDLNGTFADGAFFPSAEVHAGLVVALRGGGLIAPAIRDAGAIPLDALMAAMRDLVERARGGGLRNSELTTGTITVSIMGDGGTDALWGVIYPPQVAIVGFGSPARRALVVGDAVLPRQSVAVTLAADHRVSDGRRGARLLTEIEKLLKEPANL